MSQEFFDGVDAYHNAVDENNANSPVVLAAGMMKPGSRVLDAGCASGDTGVFLKRKLNVTLFGLEYDPVGIARARDTGVYQEVYQCDLDTFVPADYSHFYSFFDHIFLGDVLEHLRDPARALKKLANFLSPSGSMLVSLPNVAHAHVITNLLEGDFRYRNLGILDATHLRFFTWKSMARFFACTGFQITQATTTFLPPSDLFPELHTPKSVFHTLHSHLTHNRHFFVCQYVSKLCISTAPATELMQHNLDQLDKAPNNNPSVWMQIKANMAAFLESVKQLSQNSTLPEQSRIRVGQLLEQRKIGEAMQSSGLFSNAWYLNEYPESAHDKEGACHHYIAVGWRKGYNPSEFFNTQWYLSTYPEVAQAGICPLLHYLYMGMHTGHHYNDNAYGTAITGAEAADYTSYIVSGRNKEDPSLFASCSPEPYRAEAEDTKLIAFYLPQFYPFPENDAWWGKGFTEWTNVSKAVPQYVGHYQPHLPIDQGFYDLRLEEVAQRQIELARMHGIYGFCYYYYWFSGKKIMNRPVERLLQRPNLDLPFCICWANESWNARWDGGNKDVLISQAQDWDVKQFFDDILPLLSDSRYIRINRKPLLIIYAPLFFSKEALACYLSKIRLLAEENGLGGLHIVFAKTHAPDYLPNSYGGDAFVEFPPLRSSWHTLQKMFCNPRFKGNVVDGIKFVADYKMAPQPETLTYRTVFPSWDNTARRAEMGATVFENTSPEWYADWLEYAITATKKHASPEHDFVFINAWNEWGEGAHLEPDRKYGYAFLEMTKQALYRTRGNKNQ